MVVLAIETATDSVGVALGDHHGVRAQFDVVSGRRHAETLVPMIDMVCRSAGLALGDVGTVAVDIGPGLFTGLRVGLATGKALAQALGLPMVGVSSLEVLAHPTRHIGPGHDRHGDRIIVAVLDGRKGQVFSCFFRSSERAMQRVSEPAGGSVGDLVAAIEDRGQEVLCVGDGAVRYRPELETCRYVTMADDFLARPRAASLLQLALARVHRGEVVDHGAIAALYFRRPDAQINWTTRSRGSSQS